MKNYVTLPSDNQTLARVLEDHCCREEAAMAARRTRWLLAYLYMQGNRAFTFYDEKNVKIGTISLKKNGTFPLRLGDFVAEMNRIQGYLSGMDLAPEVKRQGMSLAAIRERAMAQVVSNAIVDEDELERLAPKFMHFLALYGSAGIQGKVEDMPGIGLNLGMEVVHPQEVFPFPSQGWDYTKVCGRVRSRLVALDDLESVYGRKLRGKSGSMITYDQEVGEAVDDPLLFTNDRGPIESNARIPSGRSEQGQYTLVKVRELFVVGPRNTLREYVAFSGDVIIQREKFEYGETHSPLSWATFMDSGSFYGLGMFDLLFSTIREKELLVEAMVQNTKDMDRYPVTVLPHGTVNERVAFKDQGTGMRYVMVKPEPSYDGTQPIRPITIAPHNAGAELPGRTAAFLGDMVRQVSPLRDILKEKGRVDSYSGLQFLTEQDEKSISHPVQQVQRAFGDVYRYGVGSALYMMLGRKRKLPIGRLDLGLLGVSVDWTEGMVSLSNNALPDLSRLSFGIRSLPQSEAVAKSEALAFLNNKHVEWGRFVLWSLKKGIEFAVDMDVERAAVRTALMQLLTLYNDGQYPGEVVVARYTQYPELQLRLAKEVAASPEMLMASVEVQNAIVSYMEALEGMVGGVLPEGVPDPYSLAGQEPQTADQGMPRLALTGT